MTLHGVLGGLISERAYIGVGGGGAYTKWYKKIIS